MNKSVITKILLIKQSLPPNIYKLFLYNLFKQNKKYNAYYKLGDPAIYSLAEILDNAFFWGYSAQGNYFWKSIYTDYSKKKQINITGTFLNTDVYIKLMNYAETTYEL